MRNVKLLNQERHRVRVRDLATELGTSSAAVIAYLAKIGEFASSPMSSLEEPTARLVRQEFLAEALEETAQPHATVPEAKPTGAAGLSAPTAPPRAENNPFKNELCAFRSPQPGPSSPVGPAVAERSFRSETPCSGPGDYSAAGAVELSETMAPFAWRLVGISETEEDVWRAHGLDARHARIAAECIASGITPGDLSCDVAGWTVLERITKGEPAAQVARLMRRQAGTA